MFNVICALVKGLFLSIKRRFVDVDGVEFAIQLYKTHKHAGIRKKVIALFDDLVMYDMDLGGPENLLMVEQDKIILKGRASSKETLNGKGRTSEEYDAQ